MPRRDTSVVSGLKAKPHAGHRSKAPSTTPKAWIVAGLFGRLQELGLPDFAEATGNGHDRGRKRETLSALALLALPVSALLTESLEAARTNSA